MRKERALEPPDQSVKRGSYPYPLSVITYCAHCQQKAADQDNPALRTTLTGSTDKNGLRSYKHKAGTLCGCHNRSVRCEIYEHDFGRLIQLLTIEPDKLDLLLELAIQVDNLHEREYGADLELQKREAIALCQRRIDAAVTLYGDGMIPKEEYQRRREQNRREIAHWEARTTETEQIAIELALCLEAVERLAFLWEKGTAEEKQAIARNFFDYLVYDLDTQRITDFRLKP